ncbi:MAG: HAD hydrolase-like protein, partial [Sphingomicrobium sp.]
ERGVTLHCLNPDRLVIRGGVPEACAGALADLYEQMNGRVLWYGKPHRAIYDHALGLGGNPPAEAVLAIGDALRTDILGAARMGFDAVYVAGGIHAGEPFPPDFAAEHGLGDWHPVAVVDSLG